MPIKNCLEMLSLKEKKYTTIFKTFMAKNKEARNCALQKAQDRVNVGHFYFASTICIIKDKTDKRSDLKQKGLVE